MIKLLYLNNRKLLRYFKYLVKDVRVYVKTKAKHFHKFINKLPVIDPSNKFKIIWDIIFFITIVF